jgi:hypothetical protein
VGGTRWQYARSPDPGGHQTHRVVIFAATALSIVVSSPARLAMAVGEAGGIGAVQRPEQWAIADGQVFSDARCSTSSWARWSDSGSLAMPAHLGTNLGTKRGEITQNRCDVAQRARHPKGVDLCF